MTSVTAIVTAASPADLDGFRGLCREYAAESAFVAVSLEYQGFENELATLPGKYAAPGGTILLARGDAPDGGRSWLGCVAVRPLDEVGVCELKRMFVRPEARGRGVGLALASAAVDWARRAGYRVMRLDTDASMAAAIAVYRGLGFVETDPYNTDPCPDTRWFALGLGSGTRRS